MGPPTTTRRQTTPSSAPDLADRQCSAKPAATSRSPRAPRPRAKTARECQAAERAHRLSCDRVEQYAQPWVAVARSPDGEHGAAGWPQDPVHRHSSRHGSGTSIRPSRHSTASKASSAYSIRSRSSFAGRDVRQTGRFARSAAIAVISGEKSESTTPPFGPTIAAAAMPTPPGPQASSSTRPPPKRGGGDHRLSDLGTAGVDVFGVCAPRRRGRSPNCAQCRARFVRIHRTPPG